MGLSQTSLFSFKGTQKGGLIRHVREVFHGTLRSRRVNSGGVLGGKQELLLS